MTRGTHPGKIAAAALLLLACGSYLSGYFFLWAIDGQPASATPFTPLQYGVHHGHDPRVRSRLAASSAAGFGLAIGVGVLVLVPRRRSLHGDAGYATRAEIAAAGLFAERGVLLGRLGNRYLVLGGQQGVALAAPPRSGKGVGVVIPNCLNWDGSLVCVDIKGENWAITAGYRASMGHAVYRFDPFSETGETVRWNPLGYVSEDPRFRINDLQRIAQMLYPDPQGADPFWTASARSLFLGIALYLFETQDMPRTLGEVLRQGMASDDEGFGKHWKRVIESRAYFKRPLSLQCVQALLDVIDLAPVTASSIRKTFTSRLDLWLNPMLDAATAANDFDFRDLRRRRMSVYVCVNPDDLHRLRPVMNLFFQQAIGLQTRELPEHNPDLKHQVLMMLDEFTALGRIPIVSEAIAYLPGYNVRTVLVIQTPAQLREVYGRDNAETMLKSLAARVMFAPKDAPDAQEISEELGYTTVKSKSVSRPTWGTGRGPSVSISDQRRALLLPQEVKELGTDRALLFYEGLRPIACTKLRYFDDKLFKARLLPAPKLKPIDWTNIPIGKPERFFDGPAAAHTPETADVPAKHAFGPPNASDLERLDELNRDDFSIDFDAVEIPQGRKLTEEELQRVVNDFLNMTDEGSGQ
jgi:type IV secretion system protein VirD4